MKIIDTHLHYSKIESFSHAAQLNGVNYSRSGYMQEALENNVAAGICMGLEETFEGSFPDKNAKTPMNFDLDYVPDNFYFCAGINPHELDDQSLAVLEETLQLTNCAGIKIYAGYYHLLVTDKQYDPVYRLALKYDLPVVIHSGSVYSDRGLLKFAHPLSIDDLAVEHRNLTIVIAHFGNPWLMDTVELIYKNKNVYTDLSGLLVGGNDIFKRLTANRFYMDRFKIAITQADHYEKLLYGSDWPLASMSVYIDFIRKLIPENHWEQVFYKNAFNVFKKIKI